MSRSKRLYRSILRESAALRVQPVRRKLCQNTREFFDLYRQETDPDTLETLDEVGHAVVRVISWLRRLPEVRLEGQRCLIAQMVTLLSSLRQLLLHVGFPSSSVQSVVPLLADVLSKLFVLNQSPNDFKQEMHKLEQCSCA